MLDLDFDFDYEVIGTNGDDLTAIHCRATIDVRGDDETDFHWSVKSIKPFTNAKKLPCGKVVFDLTGWPEEINEHCLIKRAEAQLDARFADQILEEAIAHGLIEAGRIERPYLQSEFV